MSINDLSEDERRLWDLCVPKTKDWYFSDCPVVRTTTVELQQAWKKACKITDLKTVELAIQAQARARRKEREQGRKPAQPKMISAWLNAGRWSLEIASDEPREKRELGKCHCGQEVHGPSFDKCTEHLGRDDKGRLQGWEANMMRDFYQRYPGIKKYNRGQLIAFSKKMMRRIGLYKKPVVWKIIGKCNTGNKNILLPKDK